MANFKDGFQRFLSAGLFVDMHLVIGTKKLPCHQLILSYSSTILRERIRNTIPCKGMRTVDISDIIGDDLADVFQADVLNYLYSGNVNLTLKNFVKLYCIAEMLDIKDLLDLTVGFMKQNVTKDSIIGILCDVIHCNAAPVVNHVIHVIAQNFSDFYENKKFDWKSLTLDMMKDLLHSSSLLVANEAHVFLAINEFLEKYKQGDLSESELTSLFETVRFEKLDYSTLEAALNHPLVPKALLSHALMLKLAKFEKPGSLPHGISKVQVTHSTPRARRESYGRLFQYSGTDFDTRGVLHYIGTQEYRHEWQNPMLAKLGVTVQFSSIEKGQAHYILDKEPKELWTQDVPSSWFQLDLGEGRALKVSAYSLRHGSSSKKDFLRNWSFKGSNDGVEWETIKRHKDDESLNGPNFCTFTWTISDSKQAYRFFRVTQIGHNSSKHNFLSVSGIELYGGMLLATYFAQERFADLIHAQN